MFSTIYEWGVFCSKYLHTRLSQIGNSSGFIKCNSFELPTIELLKHSFNVSSSLYVGTVHLFALFSILVDSSIFSILILRIVGIQL